MWPSLALVPKLHLGTRFSPKLRFVERLRAAEVQLRLNGHYQVNLGQSHQNSRPGFTRVGANHLPRSGASYLAVILSAVPCGRRWEGTESKNLSHPAGGGGAELSCAFVLRAAFARRKSERSFDSVPSRLRPQGTALRMTGFLDAAAVAAIPRFDAIALQVEIGNEVAR